MHQILNRFNLELKSTGRQICTPGRYHLKYDLNKQESSKQNYTSTKALDFKAGFSWLIL
jgi:hypothetical protein